MGGERADAASNAGLHAARAIVEAIGRSGLTIYDPLDSRPELYLSTELLECILNDGLGGLDLNYPIRTRAKIVKEAVCRAIGYPVPGRFERTQPRFPGQDFDVYVQKADNLQIWNEEVTPSRRYVLVRVNEEGRVSKVRVLPGTAIAELDKTGTLTHKYQAKSLADVTASAQVSTQDTDRVIDLLVAKRSVFVLTPAARIPDPASFLPIGDVYTCLVSLLGSTIPDPGVDQERSRGGLLHQVVCECVCGRRLPDSGQFPMCRSSSLRSSSRRRRRSTLGWPVPIATSRYPTRHSCVIAMCATRSSTGRQATVWFDSTM
jgi:hypothetical protein